MNRIWIESIVIGLFGVVIIKVVKIGEVRESKVRRKRNKTKPSSNKDQNKIGIERKKENYNLPSSNPNDGLANAKGCMGNVNGGKNGLDQTGPCARPLIS